MALLSVNGVSKSFGGVRALESVDLRVHPGTIVSLIGPNGAGKTTLFHCITGLLPPSSGQIVFDNLPIVGLAVHKITGRGISRTFQEIRLFPGMTVLENVMVGGHIRTRTGVWGAIRRGPRVVEEEQALASRAVELLKFVGLSGRADDWAARLSYGEQRRLEIARALSTSPKLLLLDEPAAGMNPRETKDLIRLIQRIRDQGITLLLIEHHMQVVMGISDQVVVLDHGVKLIEGPPATVRHDPRVIEAYLGREGTPENMPHSASGRTEFGAGTD